MWLKYVDLELMLNHMGFMNLLLFLAIKTPLLDIEVIENKYGSRFISRYVETLETLYDNIVDDMQSEEYKVGDKYRSKNEELGNCLSSSSSPFSFLSSPFTITSPQHTPLRSPTNAHC